MLLAGCFSVVHFWHNHHWMSNCNIINMHSQYQIVIFKTTIRKHKHIISKICICSSQTVSKFCNTSCVKPLGFQIEFKSTLHKDFHIKCIMPKVTIHLRKIYLQMRPCQNNLFREIWKLETNSKNVRLNQLSHLLH